MPRLSAPQRILLNVNVGDLGVGGVDGLLEHVETWVAESSARNDRPGASA